MKSFLIVVTLLAVLPVAAAPAVADALHGALPTPVASSDPTVYLQSGLRKLQANDAAGAVTDFNIAVADPNFGRLSAEQRGGAYILMAYAEIALGRFDDAYVHYKMGGEVAPKLRDGPYWMTLATLSSATDHPEVALRALGKVVDEDPKLLLSIQPPEMAPLLEIARHAPDDTIRFKVLETLWKGHYTPAEITLSDNTIWFSLFELYAARGDDAKARKVLATLSDSGTVIRLRSDKRYSRFVAAGPGQGNFDAALTAALERDRRIVADHPRLLSLVIEYASDLMNADRLEDALALLDNAEASIKAAKADAPPYDDIAAKEVWLYDTRSRVLSRLDRDEDMLATQEQARDMSTEHPPSGDTVSQRLNLANSYYIQGRPKDALEQAKGVDHSNASGYGIMVARKVEACAYAQLGDKAQLDATLTYMKAHVDVSFALVREALICAGDVDGTAALIIGRLDDPATRNDMLVAMQHYSGRGKLTDYEKSLAATNSTLYARSDLQKAIERYGVIESYPVYSASGF